MPSFSKNSLDQLETCDQRLQDLMNEAIKYINFSVLNGHRSKEYQDHAYQTGHSTLKWPQSKHDASPSLAVDIAPWPIDFENTKRYIYYAGIIKGISLQMGIPIRWGGDWNMDFDPADNKFNDLGHFELNLEASNGE